MPSGNSDTAMLARLVRRMKNREQDPLRPLIDRYILERDKPGKERLEDYVIDMAPRPRPGGRISPSSIGGCQREAVLKFLGVRGKKKIDPDRELLFDDGNWRHHRWQATFLDMEKVLGKDVFEVVEIEGAAFLKRKFVAGNFDALIKIYGVLYIIDFKGSNDAMFNRVHRDDMPLAKHIMQVLLYMKAKRVPRGIIMYDNKNNQLTKNFAVSFSAAEWEETQDWIDGVLGALERKRLPPKHHNCSSGNFQYERCPFAGLCFGGMDSTDLQDKVFRKFKSIEHSWQRGLRVIEKHDEGRADRSA